MSSASQRLNEAATDAAPTKDATAQGPLQFLKEVAKYFMDFHAHPEQWVFENPARGKPWRPSHIQSKWIRPAGLQVTGENGIGWHNFRHTFSSMLRELGTDIKVQQELLRHADVRTTLQIYTQAPSAQKREAVGKLVRMVLPKPLMDASGRRQN